MSGIILRKNFPVNARKIDTNLIQSKLYKSHSNYNFLFKPEALSSIKESAYIRPLFRFIHDEKKEKLRTYLDFVSATSLAQAYYNIFKYYPLGLLETEKALLDNHDIELEQHLMKLYELLVLRGFVIKNYKLTKYEEIVNRDISYNTLENEIKQKYDKISTIQRNNAKNPQNLINRLTKLDNDYLKLKQHTYTAARQSGGTSHECTYQFKYNNQDMIMTYDERLHTLTVEMNGQSTIIQQVIIENTSAGVLTEIKKKMKLSLTSKPSMFKTMVQSTFQNQS